MPVVTFARESITITVPVGTTLRQAAMRCGVQLYSHIFRVINCLGFGRCGECRVIVMEGGNALSPVTSKELEFKRPRSSRHRGAFGIYVDDCERLPCQAEVRGDVVVWTRPRNGGPKDQK